MKGATFGLYLKARGQITTVRLLHSGRLRLTAIIGRRQKQARAFRVLGRSQATTRVTILAVRNSGSDASPAMVRTTERVAVVAQRVAGRR